MTEQNKPKIVRLPEREVIIKKKAIPPSAKLKLDRPEIRKTLMELVANPPCKECGHWKAGGYCWHTINKLTGIYKRCKLVNQILALFDEEGAYMRGWREGNELKQKRLDIKLEMAKREERERIRVMICVKGLLTTTDKEHGYLITDELWSEIFPQNKQALRGEK